MMSISVFETTALLCSWREPFVLVTLLGVRGHAPQNIGAKAVVTSEGLRSGTVGGGKIEAYCIKRAQDILKSKGKNELVLETINLQRDIGMSCGGEVQLLFEPYSINPLKIAVFGAGHVAQALAPLLCNIPCRATFIDPRRDWLDRLPRNPALLAIETCEAGELGNTAKDVLTMRDAVKRFDEETYFICVTQGHSYDVPILQEIFLRFPSAPLIGVIGSKVKGGAIRKELAELGISSDLLERLRCPVGLAFGSNDPFEIALSIAAQILSIRDRSQ